MSSKAFQRTVSGLGVLLLSLGLMAFPPRGPTPSSAAVYDYFWRDDFATSTLHPIWSWVREDPTHWSLTDNPDVLRITTQTGGIYVFLRRAYGGGAEHPHHRRAQWRFSDHDQGDL